MLHEITIVIGLIFLGFLSSLMAYNREVKCIKIESNQPKPDKR